MIKIFDEIEAHYSAIAELADAVFDFGGDLNSCQNDGG